MARVPSPLGFVLFCTRVFPENNRVTAELTVVDGPSFVIITNFQLPADSRLGSFVFVRVWGTEITRPALSFQWDNSIGAQLCRSS